MNATKYFITEQKCDPNSQGFNRWTPLHYASHGGHMNIIKYLITEQGCEPTILNNDGNLPLHIACSNGHLNATKYFITEQKCDPNSRGFNRWTPLHHASHDTSNLHQASNGGNLPLHNACRNGVHISS